ncbi:hypothetical protein COO60DRAFT_871063 [Scenedesmus sp. NREL 46B-D3]|nr:hypothetical protein COO60DRAFT_871063 [Scenedesmus sp. NREL 46B-D3]
MAAAGDAAVSPMQVVSSSSAREGNGKMTRSQSFMSELGPLQPISESSAATYEALPPALMSPTWQQHQQQHMQAAAHQQQQMQQDVGALLLQQQVQQQVQQVAAAIAVQQQQAAAMQQQQQQQQMCCNGGGAGMSSPEAYGLAAMSCSPGDAGVAGSSSPLSARMLARHPSRLAQASSAQHGPAGN